MGMFIDGVWTRENHFPTDESGGFVRKPTTFRDHVTADGASGLAPVEGRYHLYVSYACPWAHRTLIARKLYGLESMISVSAVDHFMDEDGWRFGFDGDDDPIAGATRLRELYVTADPQFTGRVTVPVLWDRMDSTIVNNESTDIVRMMRDGFAASLGELTADLYPEPLRAQIDAWAERLYHRFNNGVYRAGFARSQQAYEVAAREVFEVLGELEAQLGKTRYLTGDQLTEADLFAFTTLVRFDAVYHTHFKCNLRRVIDYPNVWGFLRDVYQTPGVASTVHMDHIKQHYFRSHGSVNPSRVVPIGPELDFAAPHGRG